LERGIVVKKVDLKMVAVMVCLAFVVVSVNSVSAEPPPGKGKDKSSDGIWVYDANDNRIGMLIDSTEYQILVYIPELDAVTKIEPNIPGGPYTGGNWYGDIYTTRMNFDEEDYTTPYIMWSQIMPSGGSHKMLVRDACGSGDQYYISNTEIVSIYQEYYRDGDDETCTIKSEGTPGWYNNHELIPIAATDIPFPVPLLGPFRYQFAP
jgi:hypothetical protein